jgi:hypothetical protein
MIDMVPPVFEKRAERIDSERVRKHTFLKSTQVMEKNGDRRAQFSALAQKE